MSFKNRCLIISLAWAGVLFLAFCSFGEETAAEGADELGKQLNINKNALLTGKSEQIRTDAATVILFSEDGQARAILLEVLKSDNKDGRLAVCAALSHSGEAGGDFVGREDFIEPLLGILVAEKDAEAAKRIAEATLIFEYKQISKRLEQIVGDVAVAVQGRLNAIGALARPDIGAISKLMDLLDDGEAQISEAARTTLISLGIPVSGDQRVRREIIDGIKRLGPKEFLRSWKIRQDNEAKIDELKGERDWWRRQYLATLEFLYAAKDNGAKVAFLSEHLSGPKSAVKLWALDKVYSERIGTGEKANLSAGLGGVLVNLISDNDRDVRLKTAGLLSVMVEINSAQKLLDQINVESDEQVFEALFVALGGTCYYAFSSPNAEFTISLEIREQALKLASEYLSSKEASKSQKGAEVFKKLLEHEGLSAERVEEYLGLLANRYRLEKEVADGALRGELLNLMAGLCAQSFYKEQTERFFGPLFVEALIDKVDLVRQAGVDGIIYIDPVKALARFRVGVVDDISVVIREKLINLAGKIGGKEDLVWLARKVGVAADGVAAWQAMLAIFDRSDLAVLGEWVVKFDLQTAEAKVSDEQMLSFLKIVDRQMGSDSSKELGDVKDDLARLYERVGEFEQAAKYLGVLLLEAVGVEVKNKIRVELLNVYLQWGNVEATVQLLNNSLLEADMAADGAIVVLLDSYFACASGSVDVKLLDALSGVVVAASAERPIWNESLVRWSEGLKGAEKSVEVGPSGS